MSNNSEPKHQRDDDFFFPDEGEEVREWEVYDEQEDAPTDVLKTDMLEESKEKAESEKVEIGGTKSRRETPLTPKTSLSLFDSEEEEREIRAEIEAREKAKAQEKAREEARRQEKKATAKAKVERDILGFDEEEEKDDQVKEEVEEEKATKKMVRPEDLEKEKVPSGQMQTPLSLRELLSEIEEQKDSLRKINEKIFSRQFDSDGKRVLPPEERSEIEEEVKKFAAKKKEARQERKKLIEKESNNSNLRGLDREELNLLKEEVKLLVQEVETQRKFIDKLKVKLKSLDESKQSVEEKNSLLQDNIRRVMQEKADLLHRMEDMKKSVQKQQEEAQQKAEEERRRRAKERRKREEERQRVTRSQNQSQEDKIYQQKQTKLLENLLEGMENFSHNVSHKINNLKSEIEDIKKNPSNSPGGPNSPSSRESQSTSPSPFEGLKNLENSWTAMKSKMAEKFDNLESKTRELTRKLSDSQQVIDKLEGRLRDVEEDRQTLKEDRKNLFQFIVNLRKKHSHLLQEMDEFSISRPQGTYSLSESYNLGSPHHREKASGQSESPNWKYLKNTLEDISNKLSQKDLSSSPESKVELDRIEMWLEKILAELSHSEPSTEADLSESQKKTQLSEIDKGYREEKREKKTLSQEKNSEPVPKAPLEDEPSQEEISSFLDENINFSTGPRGTKKENSFSQPSRREEEALKSSTQKTIDGEVATFTEDSPEFTPSLYRSFLQFLLYEKKNSVSPRPDSSSVIGYVYPELMEWGKIPRGEETSFLEGGVEAGYFSKRMVDKIHLCPQCFRYNINFREVCPQCFSLDLETTEALVHYSCDYLAPEEKFARGGHYVCPICEELMEQPGIDHEEALPAYNCQTCHETFTEAQVECRCLHCQSRFSIGQAILCALYQYEISKEGKELLQSSPPEEKREGSREDSSATYSFEFAEEELEDKWKDFREDLAKEIAFSRRMDLEMSLLGLRLSPRKEIDEEDMRKALAEVLSAFYSHFGRRARWAFHPDEFFLGMGREKNYGEALEILKDMLSDLEKKLGEDFLVNPLVVSFDPESEEDGEELIERLRTSLSTS